MKRIPLTQGQIALVDDEDYERLNQWKWYAYYNPRTKSYYACRCKNRKVFWMHREIMKIYNPKIIVDHKNHNTLDNQKINLRECNQQQNNFNRIMPKNNTSGYKGVVWSKQRKKWKAYIVLNTKQYYLGLYAFKKEAALAYNEKAKELFGEFAYINNI